MIKPSRMSAFFVLGFLGSVGDAFAQQNSVPTGEVAATTTTTSTETTTATIDGSQEPSTTANHASPPAVPVSTVIAPVREVTSPVDVSRKVEASESPPKTAVAKPKKDDEKHDESSLPVWERSPKIKLGGYVHTAFVVSRGSDKVSNEFRVRNARIQLKWNQGNLLDGEIEVEMAQEIEGDSDSVSVDSTWAPLRDAFVRVTPLKQVAFRLGQFRRPFSRIALTSPRTLKLVNRGISDAWINSELLYGARDVGFQVEGSFGKNWGFDYAVGVFNGTGRNTREIDAQGAKDFVGRVVGHLGKHVEIGANVANKNWDNPPNTVSSTANAWMWGGDVAVDYKNLFGMVESGYGDDYRALDSKKSWYVLGLFAYKIKLTDTWNMALEPLVKGEVLTLDDSNGDSRIVAGTAGANLYLGNLFRLMVQGEWIHPTDETLLPNNLGEAENLKRLFVQLALHTK